MPFLSVIIPAYNEEARLVPSLEVITRYFSVQPYKTEIVVVDDGSSDRTCDIVLDWQRKSALPVRLEKNPCNMGKGAAVKRGMLAGAGEYTLFMDADLSTPLETMQDFLPVLRQGADVVIGTRKHPLARIQKYQPWLRRNLAKGFVVLANSLLGTRLTDFTCGFKCFSHKAAQEVFSRSLVSGWAFDGEILFLAQRLGYKVVEIPVTWAHAGGSRVKLRRDVFGSFIGLLAVRSNARRGRYNLPQRSSRHE